MANNQYVNKVVYGNSTVIDLSGDTVTRSRVADDCTFHLPTGEKVSGSLPSRTSSDITYTVNTTNHTSFISVEAGNYGSIHNMNGPSASELCSGTKSITTAGTSSVTGYANVNVNIPETYLGFGSCCYIGQAAASTTTLAATSATVTVPITGTYSIYWVMVRSDSSSAAQSRAYKGTTAIGTAKSISSGSYATGCSETGQSLTKGQTITIYAKKGSTNRYCTIWNLVLVRTA